MPLRLAKCIARQALTEDRSPPNYSIPTWTLLSKRICSSCRLLFAIHKRMDPVIDTSEIAEEIGARLREELDYEREAKHMRLYRDILDGIPNINVPVVMPDLSTRRLVTMSWLEGQRLLNFKDASLETRNLLASLLFKAWWHPFCGHAVIHGDPHLGNYSAALDGNGVPAALNLLDYGCIRIFPPSFVGGVVDLYEGLKDNDRARIVHAYETWGFKDLSNELIDILNIWARFIYGPLDGRPGTGDRRWREAGRIWPAASLRSSQGAEGEGTGARAARVRVHGSRGDRARRRFHPFAGGTEFLPIVQRSVAGLLGSGRVGSAIAGFNQGRACHCRRA